jgi:hypothetical protein
MKLEPELETEAKAEPEPEPEPETKPEPENRTLHVWEKVANKIAWPENASVTTTLQ